jgi:hypothetical protein
VKKTGIEPGGVPEKRQKGLIFIFLADIFTDKKMKSIS